LHQSQLTYPSVSLFRRPIRYNSRASSANSSSVKWVSQLAVQLTELGATGPK